MNTTKKLIIGAVALTAVVTGMQGQEENVFIGDREVLDYRNAGLKEFKRAHRLYKAHTLRLDDNDLGQLVLPAGMVYLKTISLTGNNNLTNLFLQQDTAIEDPFLLDVYLDDIDNLKISLPSWITGFHVLIPFDPQNNPSHLKYYRRVINGRIRVPINDIPNLEVRPNGVELVKESDSLPFYKNSWIESRPNLVNGKWDKYFSNSNRSPNRDLWHSRRAGRIEHWFPTFRTEFHPAWGNFSSSGFFRLNSWNWGEIKAKPEEPTPIPIPVKEIE